MKGEFKLKQLLSDAKKQLHSILIGKSIRRPPFIDDAELISFTVNLTNIDKETVSRVLESEFLFLRLKGVIK